MFQAKVTVIQCSTVFVLETVVFNFQAAGTETGWVAHTARPTHFKTPIYTAASKTTAVAEMRNDPT